MYLKHFGLNELPFRITPDPSFAYANQHHQEALNTLLLALDQGEGFVKISGEVGTGKTLLCRRLLQSLGDDWVTAYLPNPNLDPDTLFLAIAEELGIKDAAGLDQFHLMRRINLVLLDLARAKKRVAVCIDEAQAMLGGVLPEISKQTHEAIMGELDRWAANGIPEGSVSLAKADTKASGTTSG